MENFVPPKSWRWHWPHKLQALEHMTLLLRFVWLLFSGSALLWVTWHRLHNCHSSYHFWSQPEVQSQTWNWRCLLRLRDLASSFLISGIKDGQSTSFWFDNWTLAGPLISVFGRDGTRRLRIRIDACVAEACNDSGWRLSNPRSDKEVNLHAYLSTITFPSPELGSDSFAWDADGIVRPSYSSAKTWEVLRPRGTIQPSTKHIWFSGATPKHAFHMWVTNLNRLPTRDRLSSWGMQVPTCCCICTT